MVKGQRMDVHHVVVNRTLVDMQQLRHTLLAIQGMDGY